MFNGEWQDPTQPPWLPYYENTLGVTGGKFFPTNFLRLAEQYQYFNGNYEAFTAPGYQDIQRTEFEVFFRAIQTDDCIVEEDDDGTQVRWHPFQDQLGSNTTQYDGPAAVFSRFEHEIRAELGNNSIIDTDDDGIVDNFDEDSTLSETDGNAHPVCNVTQGGHSTGGFEFPVFGRLASFFPTYTQWNQGGLKSNLFLMIQSEEPLFTDPKGFYFIENGVYTDYQSPTTTGQNQDEVPWTAWAYYDYFFRPKHAELNVDTPDPYVIPKRYRSVFQQAQPFECD